MSPTAVAYLFGTSSEHEADVVAANYQKYLGRAASTAEIAGWVRGYEAGLTNEEVIGLFLGSTKYWTNHGSTASTWLDAAYEDHFARSTDTGAYTSWLADGL